MASPPHLFANPGAQRARRCCCCRVPATSAGGGNVPVLSGQRHRSSGRSSAEGDPRRRLSTDEAVAAAHAAAAAGGRSRMRPGASGELSSQVGPPAGGLQLAVLSCCLVDTLQQLRSGQAAPKQELDMLSVILHEAWYRSLQPEYVTLRSVTVQSHPSGQTSGPSASPRAAQLLQGDSTPRTEGGAESLGPAVRVLLPGKQSLTRGELAAATNALQVRTARLPPCRLLQWQRSCSSCSICRQTCCSYVGRPAVHT